MTHTATWTLLPAPLLALVASLVLASPAAALNADYWRGGWRTPLGEAPHLYQFVIRGTVVTGVYCRNCSDATTIGFIDGTWNEKTGIAFKVTFATPAGKVTSTDDQQAMLVDGRLIITGAGNVPNGKLSLIKDPRGADPGGAPAYHLPPGTPPALPAGRAAGAGAAPGGGAAGGGAPGARAAGAGAPGAAAPAPGGPAAPAAGAPARGAGAGAPAGGGGGGRGFGGGGAAYWQAGPFKSIRPEDVVGTWIASFGLGMNRQVFTFLRVGDRIRGVVCGRCDNTYTTGPIENVVIVGDKLYFDIIHEDWGEIDPPTFERSIVAQIVQNEMLAGILGNSVVIDPAKPPERPARGGFTLVGPIAPESTRGNTSEGIDVWGPGTGSSVQPPPGRTPIIPAFPK